MRTKKFDTCPIFAAHDRAPVNNSSVSSRKIHDQKEPTRPIVVAITPSPKEQCGPPNDWHYRTYDQYDQLRQAVCIETKKFRRSLGDDLLAPLTASETYLECVICFRADKPRGRLAQLVRARR